MYPNDRMGIGPLMIGFTFEGRSSLGWPDAMLIGPSDAIGQNPESNLAVAELQGHSATELGITIRTTQRGGFENDSIVPSGC